MFGRKTVATAKPDFGPFRARVRIEPTDDFSALVAEVGATIVPPWSDDRVLLEARHARMHTGEAYEAEPHAFFLHYDGHAIGHDAAFHAFARLGYRFPTGHEMLKMLVALPRLGQGLLGVWSLNGPVINGYRLAFRFAHRPGPQPGREFGLVPFGDPKGKPYMRWPPGHLFVGIPLRPDATPTPLSRFDLTQ